MCAKRRWPAANGHRPALFADLAPGPLFHPLSCAPQWTVSLCTKDGDGDGQTNGFELGDPCCVWAEGNAPANTTLISNPGSAASMTKRVCTGITCPNGVDPCTPKNSTLRGAATA